MATATKPDARRKRNRKRKRRVAFSSSSSSSSSSSGSASDGEAKPKQPVKSVSIPPVVEPADFPSESSSEESSLSSSDDDKEPGIMTPVVPDKPVASDKKPRHFSPSPSPPPAEIPTFLNTAGAENKDAKELAMKEKFRKFWMASVADGFKDDLEEISKEPNMGTSRLALLIDSLASGAEVFTSSSQSDNGNNLNEVEVILQ